YTTSPSVSHGQKIACRAITGEPRSGSDAINGAVDRYRSLVAGRTHGLWPGMQRAGLRLASVPYGWAVRCRNWLYERDWKRTFKAQTPVVSVGNLTLGGTGKTPCVEYVARHYRKADLRAAILSRG